MPRLRPHIDPGMLKPNRDTDFPGDLVISGGAISVNDIVIENGYTRGLKQVIRADADAVLTARGRLWVALGAAGASGAEVRVVKRNRFTMNTAASAVGDPVYMSGTAGGVTLTAPAFPVQVGEVLSVGVAGHISVAPSFDFGGGGAGAAMFGGLILVLNDDAAAATNEDPIIRMLGGDGAEIVRGQFLLDSSADTVYFHTSLASLIGTVGDRTSQLTIGPMGDANAAGNDVDSVLQLRYHVAGDAVGTWRTFTISADAGNNSLQISGSHAAALVDMDAGGALSLNSSGGVINVGNDAVAQAINVGTGAAARTVTIGNVTGATAVVLNAGTGASSITVTGAGTFSLVAGTGAVGLANNATDHSTTIGSTTGVSAFTARAGTGAMTFTAGGAFDVNATGAVTVDSSGGTIGIGTVADAFAVNIGTAGARAITVGNGTGATSIVIDCGTGALDIGVNAIAHTVRIGNATGATAVAITAGTGASSITVTGAGTFDLVGGTGAINLASNATDHALTIGSVTGASALTLRAGTGAMTLTAGGILDVNATGAVTIDSTAGALGMGEGADAFNINIGTGGAARIITIGNGTGATSLVLNCGTGALNIGTNLFARTITIGNATGASSVVVDVGTGAFNLGSNATDHATTLGSTTGVSTLTLQSGTGGATARGLRTTSTTAVAIVGATVLTIADSGGTFSVGQGAAYDIDLPNPTVGAGLDFVFYLTGPGANNVTVTVAGAAATFVGTIVNDVTSVIPATGSTLTFASATAALGDTIWVRSISTTLYLIGAVTSAAGGITIA